MSKQIDWVPAGSIRSKNIGKLLSEREWCYFIPVQHGDGGFIPACAIENVEGYRMMSGNGEWARPWYWGKTEGEAIAICEEKNAQRGISKERAQEIMLSTMGNLANLANY